MNTVFQKTAFDKKEKSRRYSLQWMFADANEKTVRRISDKRDAGVWTKTQETPASGGHCKNNKNDGLPGCLWFEGLLGVATFGGLLSALFHGVNAAALTGMEGEIQADRGYQPEFSYYPL